MRWTRFMLALIVALSTLASAPAESALSADEAPLAVDWRASEACPTRAELLDRLQRLIPELPVPETIANQPGATLRVSVAIESSDSVTWTARLRFEGARGVDERSFAGPDCSALTDAASLVIAVALDPVLTAQRITIIDDDPTPPEDPAIVDEAPRDPAEAEEPSTADPQPRVRSTRADKLEPARETIDLRGSVGLLAGGGVGPLRAGFASVGGELSLFGPQWRASLLGLWLPPRTLSHAAGLFRYVCFVVGARGCGVPSLGALELPMCAGLEAGAIRGRGTGLTPEPREARIPSVALSLGAGLRWVLRDRVALTLQLDVPINLVRAGFSIEDAVVQELAPVGVRGLAGVELRFPASAP